MDCMHNRYRFNSRGSRAGEHARAHSAFAGSSVETILDMVYTPDVYMHGLDLARASGLPAVVDPEYATNLLVGMRQMGDYLRTGGQYGPEFPPATIVPTNQWLYIGRDPAWSQA